MHHVKFMQDPEEPVAFHSPTHFNHWHWWGLALFTNVLVLGNWSDSSIHFSDGFRREFFGNVLLEAQDGAAQLSALKLKRHLSCSRWWHFFLQSISQPKNGCNLALNFFFKHERFERKQSCIRIHIALHTKRNWLCDSALPKEKPFYCGNSYAFRYVFQSPCKTLWQIFSAETTGWERTHNSRGSQREVRFAEFFLSSEGKNDDLVSLQEL